MEHDINISQMAQKRVRPKNTLTVRVRAHARTRIVCDAAALPPVFHLNLVIPENAHAVLLSYGVMPPGTSHTVTATIMQSAFLETKNSIETDSACTVRFAAYLEGRGASVKDTSTYIGRGNAAFDIERAAVHVGAVTSSHLEARGVVDESARAVWRGRVRVEHSARGARAFQKHGALLAGEHAFIDASPALEIYTDDVACGHSASVERINRDHVFYAMSRGVPEPTARRMLISGFLSPHVSHTKHAEAAGNKKDMHI